MAVDAIALCVPQNALLTATNPPDITVVGAMPDEMIFLAYDDTTAQTAYWLCWCPTDYASGGFTVTLAWLSRSTSTNNFGAQVGFSRIVGDTFDIDASSWSTNKAGTFAHNGTSDGHMNVDTITCSNGSEIDSIGAGEFFLVRLYRDTGVTSDLTGDVLVAGMSIRET